MRSVFFTAVYVLGALASTTQAQDYKPVVCTATKPYVGEPVRTLDLAFLSQVSDQSAQAFDPATQDKFFAALTKAQGLTGATHMGVAVYVPGKGLWQAHTGDTPQPLFHWASAGKTFTAVAILQLVEDGRINLDDTVSQWVDDVPNGEVITIRHLLNHTSGLFSANEDLQLRKKPRVLSLEEEVEILNKHGAMFCPGENWRYSNSGYTLLGAILEKVEQKPYAQIIADRILTPLELAQTRVATVNDELRDVVPALPPPPGEPAADPRRAGPAGGIVASPTDIVRFWQGLLTGKLSTPDTVKLAFGELYPMFGLSSSYGLGVMTYGLPDGVWVGHSGGGPGLKAVVAYDPRRHAFVAVSLSGNKGAEATAYLLVQQLDE